jgi:hypothetical protein
MSVSQPVRTLLVLPAQVMLQYMCKHAWKYAHENHMAAWITDVSHQQTLSSPTLHVAPVSKP